ncbi:WD40/YVTN/BNR-like repeat-containing protein [Hyphomicrobium sp.]|uniref:WD40/YVTN/BNR-like repeat-containing protein n=1 Tax=Hyphomicrobium sp. TaxID=82 RepID=UPI002CC0302B|nr:hypothetical protein [Hyphomicrobium sp.]HVZ04310.1 hypothetical protein [Hyphomicrobium sp.]
MKFAAACLWALIFAAAGSSASVADENWKFAGWYGGGCYPNVEFDPFIRNQLYVTSDVAGIWRSKDGGSTWHFITDGLTNLNVSQVAASHVTAGTLYAGTAAGLYYSRNSGDKWNKTNDLGGRIKFGRPESYRAIAPHPAKAHSVCVGTFDGNVFCSDNDGATWSDLSAPHSATASSPVVSLDYLRDGSGLIVAKSKEILRYDFAGHSWKNAEIGTADITDMTRSASGYIAAAGGELWTSDNTGLKWQRAIGRHPGKVFRVAYDDKDSITYAAFTRDWTGGLLISADSGASWQVIGQTVNPDDRGNPTRRWAASDSKKTSLKIDPFDPNTIFQTDWWGIWRSTDQGVNFSEVITGAPNTVGTDLAITPAGELYAASMDDGLLKSSDHGKTYTPIFPSSSYKSDESGHVWRVMSLDKGRLLATSSPWNRDINQVLLSDDGGGSFRKIRTGLPSRPPRKNTLWDKGYPRALAVSPHDKRTVYLGIDGDDGGGLFISHDAGETWSRSPGQPPSLRIYSGLAVDLADPNTIYWGAVGDAGGIYRSTDGGKSWKIVFQGSRAIFEIDVARDGAIYASGSMGGGALFVSRDHGTTWKTLKVFGSESAKPIALSPVDTKTLAVGTVNWSGNAPEQIYLSRNGGATWRDVTGDLPPGSGAAAMKFSPDGNYIYMSRSGGGIYRLPVGALSN